MKRKILGFFALVLALSFTACNNDADTTTAEDTTSTTTTSSGDYAAMADEFQRNSEAGVYRDVRTGEPIKISVNKTTGAKLNAETNEPIVRYIWVDNNDWWVYDDQGTKVPVVSSHFLVRYLYVVRSPLTSLGC